LKESQNKFDDKNNKNNLELKNPPFNKSKDAYEEKEDNNARRFTLNEPISKISNKLEFNYNNQDEMNKKENSQDLHISRNALNMEFKNNDNNINKEGEYNGEEKG